MNIDNTIYKTVADGTTNFVQYGWICSKCGRSWGPAVVGCPICNNEQQTFSWNVTTAKMDEKNRDLQFNIDPNDITTSDFF